MKSNRIIIEPGRSERNYWRDIWSYRELFYILSWRDIKVRYKQTVIGAAWSVIRPLLTTIIFTVVFSRVAKMSAPGGAPYALMVFAGMLPWQFFANALGESSNSLVSNANLISKVYFPRMIIPISSIVTSIVDLAISFVLMLLMMIYFQFVPDIKILLLPVFVFGAVLSSLGVGLLVTALNVKFRDFRYVIPFIIQIGLYVTPIGFSSGVIPEKWRIWYALNPMVGIVDGFRWCLLGEGVNPWAMIVSWCVIFMFLWLGISYFRRTEKSFADNI
ncbi:MAG TPA: ABC transporter permease [Cyclobacteriaceae bacterium]|nr:ABC transporter permease [Cyclobacteriaceae bacterium]